MELLDSCHHEEDQGPRRLGFCSCRETMYINEDFKSQEFPRLKASFY